MSIFSNSLFGGSFESLGADFVPAFEGYVDLQDASLEATTVVEGSLSGLVVTEGFVNRKLSLNEMTIESAASVMEAAGGNVISRMKDAFKRLLAKIKGWIANIKRSFQIQFTKGAEFVNKFKKEINEKSAADFEYKGHKWSISNGENKANQSVGAVTAEINKIIDASNATTAITSTDVIKAGATNDTATYNDDNKSEKIDTLRENSKKALLIAAGVAGDDEMTDVTKYITEEYRGEDTADTIKNFSVISRSTMMDHVKGSTKSVETIEKNNKKQQDAINNVIKLLNKAEKEINKEEAGNSSSHKTSAISVYVSAANYGVNLISTITAAQTAMVKASSAEFEGALKSFLRYKGKKNAALESYTTVEGSTANSIIESVIGSF